MLALADIKTEDCRDYVKYRSAVCWHLLDEVIRDYEIAKGEAGKDRFLAVSSVFAQCIRSEMVYQIVDAAEKRNDSDP